MVDPDITAAEAVENSEDEQSIVNDQDETSDSIEGQSDDQVMGGNGTPDDFGTPKADFAQGDIDLVDQVERTTRAFDHALGIDRR
jgi:hypothetical protein